MNRQEESRFYELVRGAVEQFFKVKGYSVDFEITSY